MKIKIVLSGANITSGGPLTIYNDALKSLSSNSNLKIIAIVCDKRLFYNNFNITFIELPNYKKNVILKFYYEYIYYNKISKDIRPDIWLSLNDFTPRVSAKTLFTYFHNASIFFQFQLKDFIFSTRAIFQKYYYTIFVRFFIFNNNRFIVQQNWIGNKVNNLYKLPAKNILIFSPNKISKNYYENSISAGLKSDKFIIFYPTRAYGYKNIEFICEVLKILFYKFSIKNIELRITLCEDENFYAKYLFSKYYDLPIIWMGAISRSEVEENYKCSNVMIYPSRLETWGLPLSEFSMYSRPILAIDKEYVYETLYNYNYLFIFKPNEFLKCAEFINNYIHNKKIDYFTTHKSNIENFLRISNWNDLLDLT
jgi:hypothetical protein